MRRRAAVSGDEVGVAGHAVDAAFDRPANTAEQFGELGLGHGAGGGVLALRADALTPQDLQPAAFGEQFIAFTMD